MNKKIGILCSSVLFSMMLSACQSEVSEVVEGSADVTADVTAAVTADVTADVTAMHTAEITVYKSPTCGCCTGWVTYLEEEGFKVTAVDHDNVDAIKTKYGLTDPKLKSCHTAIVDGYVVEGHVPANDIERLLKQRPSGIAGLSAPGMPMMSPGMGSRTPKDYAVLSFKDSGEAEVYSQY